MIRVYRSHINDPLFLRVHPDDVEELKLMVAMLGAYTLTGKKAKPWWRCGGELVLTWIQAEGWEVARDFVEDKKIPITLCQEHDAHVLAREDFRGLQKL